MTDAEAPSDAAPAASPWKKVALGGVVVVLAALLVVAFTPLFDDDLSGEPEAMLTYDEAVTAARALEARDGDDVAPECRSRVVDQGERTAKAVVLLHGFTNCPAQFEVIAEAYADQGVSVVVPRLPHHGLSDRLTDDLSELTPGELVELTGDAVDIAAGLGDEVTVVGLSAGGSLAAWAAANRDDVGEAVLIAPLVAPKVLPVPVVEPFARLARLGPDVHLWWDSDLKGDLATPPYAYPRYSLRSLGAVLAVGRAAHGDIGRDEPLDRLVVVTNENDGAVSNAAVGILASALVQVADAETIYVFPEDLGLGHDVVDPEGEDKDGLPESYAVLGDLLDLPELVERLDDREG
ncbi:alpha/beta hydrolase [Paraoerskovia marina]|uniref:alpha/beta hydrolase n=1 Tax=Paraoerskovia marina TaxID=545619 RepID=UPI00049234DE|nr:alpha/beta fold hydrolase [Paraoerskovia marina]